MGDTFVIFKEISAQSKLSPNGRKFAQSGHPALGYQIKIFMRRKRVESGADYLR
jgi:hypothetical protein